MEIGCFFMYIGLNHDIPSHITSSNEGFLAEAPRSLLPCLVVAVRLGCGHGQPLKGLVVLGKLCSPGGCGESENR